MSEALPPLPAVLHKTNKDGQMIKYKIKEKMGSGGFACVYSGVELPSNRPIAIKCISQKRIADPRVKRKIMSEVEIQKSLNHPNIVEFKGVFQDENYVYILLELCPGGTVLEELKKNNPFPEKKAAIYLQQLLKALVYLHKNRVIHRDLKLQNFLLDSEGNMKLADFGLSAQLKDDDEKKNTICGTPSYLSPEVVGGGGKSGHTVAVDVWATGVCAFLMMTGKQPFQSSDKKVTYSRITHVNYSFPEKPILSNEAKDFINSALQKDPEMRPTAAELLHHPFITKYCPDSSAPISSPTQPIMSTLDRRGLTTLPPHSSSSSSSSEEEDDAPMRIDRLPLYAVRIWWDYSHRYGLAYMLHNHVCGACFNDSSRILMDPEGAFCQYWANPQTPEPQIVEMGAIESSPLRKKLLLIQHFAAELKARAGAMRTPPLRVEDRAQAIPHVKYWARTKDGVLFRMANRDIQANFRDHTKLVIESASKTLFYDTGRGVQQLTLSDLGNRERFHEVRKRFILVKEMAKELI